MKDTVVFGILGAGPAAPLHAQAIRSARGAILGGVCDADPNRAAALAAEFGVPSFPDAEALLAHPDLDAVDVLVPRPEMGAAVAAAAAAGRHVLTDTPPATSVEEAGAMVDACSRAGVRLGCAAPCRISGPVRALRAAVEAGRFGRLLYADATMKWFRPAGYARSGSCDGMTVTHAFPDIDLLRHVMGPVAVVRARMTNLAHPAVAAEDTVQALLEFASGARGLIQASTAVWPGTGTRIEINGTDGGAVLENGRLTVWEFREALPDDARIRADCAAPAGEAPPEFGFGEHRLIVEDFAEAVLTGRMPAVPVRSVIPTIALVAALYASAKRDEPVSVTG